ncbi:Homeobox-leucine zipper protein HAT3 [Morus notabilis]|uniref:Homeobox-leucine zipper protein HAT3 n=1 Tax=Morus notabilis TaxID=981085 RepID=W9QQ84_9ROSA|nr:homeobox-leucine zipper protein HAT3 [Morus notabilis]EXB37628.1 Homeobox-leucine zipper protein HAT3 [Morus notabilis]
MGEKDDDGLGLGLSLSLGIFGGTTTTATTHTTTHQPGSSSSSSLKFNLMQKPSSSSMQYQQKTTNTTATPWNEIFQLSDRNSDGRSFLRGLDVNLTPSFAAAAAADYDEENGVSSPNSTISSISGKKSEREAPGGEEAEEGDRDSCSRGGGGSDDEDGGNGGGDASRKKLRLTKDQSLILEETFKEHNTLNPKQKLALAKELNLRPRQVEVWFQNRRARTKLKQTEVDCEYLKRCCENLTEENRRLQKEVQELRALKLSPQLYMHMSPPTTLTMCPSCERVAASSSLSSTAAAAPNGSNRQPAVPSIPRPVPINPWAALPIPHRPLDTPASRS